MTKLIFIFLTFLSMPLLANEQQLLDLLKEKTANKQSLAAAIKAGDKRALLCKFCHGTDGNSKKTSIPNLAQQNTTYLIRQFEFFASGKRVNKTMNEMAKLLTAEDKVNIALFYSNQKLKSQTPYKPELFEKGKTIFSTKCFFCHGKKGYGKEDIPHIASQPADYVVRTLSSYTSFNSKRADSPMTRVAKTLTQNEVQALAAYLTTLR